jgi:hypothetical protein
MKIIFREWGWRWLRCVIAHRPFYKQDSVAEWYCDVCKHQMFNRIQRELDKTKKQIKEL